MTEPEPTSGQPAPESGQPAEPTSQPEQPSGQPAGEPYWKSEYDKLANQTKDAIELRDWVNARPEAKKLLYDFATGALNKPEAKPSENFNADTDFDMNEALTKPTSESGKYLRQAFRDVVREEMEPVQAQMKNAEFRRNLSGMAPEIQSKYEDFLTNMENHMDVVYGPLAEWFAQYAGQPPPSQTPSALQGVRSNKNALPPTGTVQGAAPAEPDVTEEMFKGILKGVKPSDILSIGK